MLGGGKVDAVTKRRPKNIRPGGPTTRRYSLRVGTIRSSVLIACAALAASCAPSAPPMEIPVTTRVNVSRVISGNIPPRPSDCTIETLTAMPTQPYRELGAIEVADGDLNQHDTLLMIDQNACAMGADAIVVVPARSNSRGGTLEATAVAYANNLATRAAQPPAAETAGDALDGESHGRLAQVPDAQKLPSAAASDEPPSSPDSAQRGAASAPITEQQIGPAEAPSPTPAASLSAAPAARAAFTDPDAVANADCDARCYSIAYPVGNANASSYADGNSITNANTGPRAHGARGISFAGRRAPSEEAPTPSVATSPPPVASATPTPSPSHSSSSLKGGAGAAAIPLSLFKIVPEEDPDKEEVPGKDEEPDSAPSPQNSPAPIAAGATSSTQSATPSPTPSPAPSPSTTPAVAPSPSTHGSP